MKTLSFGVPSRKLGIIFVLMYESKTNAAGEYQGQRQPEVKLQICKIDRPRKIIGQIDLTQLAP